MKRFGYLFPAVISLTFAVECLGKSLYQDGTVQFAREADANSTDANAPVTLPDYLRLAALNNAGLKAAFEEWKAAVEQVPQARALPDPRFTYAYYIQEIETRVGPQKNRLGIMQLFPWFGEIEARADAAAAAAKAARQRYEAAKLKLFFQVKDAFHEYVYLASAVQIAKDNLELIKHFEEVARTKYIAAAAGHPDVIRAQMELAKLEDHVKTLEDLRNPIVARLNAVLNRADFTMLAWPRRQEFQHTPVQRSRVIAILKAQNPQLQELDFEVQSSRSALEAAKKKFYPNMGVGVDWIDTGDRSGVRDGGTDAVILMFTMDLPIWRKSYKAAEMQAEANVRKARQQRIETENTILARTERVLYDFEDSSRKVGLYADVLVPKAKELLSVSETAYKGGTVDFLSLIDAQRMLLGYQLNYERSVTDNLQRLAELEMLAGTELSSADSAAAAQ